MLSVLIYMIINFRNRSYKKIERLSSSINEIETIFVRSSNSIEKISKNVTEIEKKIDDLNELQEKNRIEIIRLADGFGGQSQVSKAIDLARAGATVSEIIISTGLSEEESEAIAKFHNPNLK